MRVVLHQYANGDLFVYETSDDGSEVVGEIEGEREVNERIRAFVEAGSDINDDGLRALAQGLERVRDAIQQRLAQEAPG